MLRYPYAILRDLSRGQINLYAMGLVYATLLSLIPLIAFAFAVLKAFGAHRELQPLIQEFFRPLGATGAAELTHRVMEFADSVSTGLVGSVGLALLLWTLLGTIKKVEDGFNFLWRVEHARSFARRVTEYVALLIVGPIVVVSFIGLSHRALDSTAGFGRYMPFWDRLTGWSLEAAPFFMVTAIFTAVYMFVPNTKVKWKPALIGGVAAGILWVVVGQLFTAFVVYHHAALRGVRRLRHHRRGAAVDLFRLADPADRRAAVVLRAEPQLPAPRPHRAAPVRRAARAAHAQGHVPDRAAPTTTARRAGRWMAWRTSSACPASPSRASCNALEDAHLRDAHRR